MAEPRSGRARALAFRFLAEFAVIVFGVLVACKWAHGRPNGRRPSESWTSSSRSPPDEGVLQLLASTPNSSWRLYSSWSK